jgi:hypothetical protein
MQALRTSQALYRLILAWFGLALAVAIMSPIVQPKSFQVICLGSGGTQLMLVDDGGQPVTAAHTVDCPLCLPISGPPTHRFDFEPVALAHLQYVDIPATHLQADAPWSPPARGPPTYS